MSFEEKVIASQDESSVVLERSDLEEICPHRDIALIASFGIIENEKCSLVLKPEDFGPYINGHEWYIPLHWLGEMAALTSGLQAIRNIVLEKGIETAKSFKIPSLLAPGSWEKGVLTTDPKGNDPIITTIKEIGLHIGGRSRFTANVEISQGAKSAVWSGIKVLLLKGGSEDEILNSAQC